MNTLREYETRPPWPASRNAAATGIKAARSVISASASASSVESRAPVSARERRAVIVITLLLRAPLSDYWGGFSADRNRSRGRGHHDTTAVPIPVRREAAPVIR